MSDHAFEIKSESGPTASPWAALMHLQSAVNSDPMAVVNRHGRACRTATTRQWSGSCRPLLRCARPTDPLVVPSQVESIERERRGHSASHQRPPAKASGALPPARGGDGPPPPPPPDVG